MIDSLNGILIRKAPGHAIVDLNGVRFYVSISIGTYERLPEIGKKVELLTYLHVREDILQLYGFERDEQRTLFMLLIGVSGIGPRSAMSIMSGASTEEFKHRIINDDVKALTVIPGIGAKTAKRIIIELKEKFIKDDSNSIPDLPSTGEQGSLVKDALNALASLGYQPSAAKKALSKLKDSGELEGSLENIIKKALTNM